MNYFKQANNIYKRTYAIVDIIFYKGNLSTVSILVKYKCNITSST